MRPTITPPNIPKPTAMKVAAIGLPGFFVVYFLMKIEEMTPPRIPGMAWKINGTEKSLKAALSEIGEKYLKAKVVCWRPL